MTQEEIIKMLEQEWRDRLEAAVKQEREACAERAWKALINKGADWSVRQLVSDAITQKGET